MLFGIPFQADRGILPGELAAAIPPVEPAPFPGAPNEPFMWGAGGRRMTPEEIALARKKASGGIDYSPIASPWQGLARVADAGLEGLDLRRADKAEAANSEAAAQIRAALTTNADAGTLINAAADPYLDEGTRSVAGELLKAQLKPKPEPPEIIQLSAIANDPSQPAHIRQAASDRVTAINDPFTVIQTKTGTYAGRGSIVEEAMRGGGGGGMAISPDAVAELRSDPSPQAQAEFDEVFGAGMAGAILGQGGPASDAPGGFPYGQR